MHRILLGILVMTGLGGWLTLGLLVMLTTPESSLRRFVFFVLLFTSVSATASLGAYALGNRLFPWKRFRGDLGMALLQGIPPALVITGGVWLQSLRAFTWTQGLILLGIMGITEYILIPRGGRRL